MLTAAVTRVRQPLAQLKLQYGGSKGKNYTEDEDRFLLVQLERLGYSTEDVYDRIRAEIKRCALFRFDWFLRSRTSVELARRCATLVSLLQRDASLNPAGSDEDEEDEGSQQGKTKKQKITV